MTEGIKTTSVRRTSYHSLILRYGHDPSGRIVIKHLIPDVGPLPKNSAIDPGPYPSLTEARRAVRTAMGNKEALRLDFITITPGKWIQFVLALDEYLVENDMSFDDLTLDKADVKLSVKRMFPNNPYDDRVDKLVGEYRIIGDYIFKHEFGIIDWTKFELV